MSYVIYHHHTAAIFSSLFFFFNDTATTEIYTLSLHDALPICQAKRIVIDKDNTTIVGGKGKRDAIQGRINEIKAAIDKSTSDYDKEKLQERLAKLAGGVAVINVGAATETEMKEKKARVGDALPATPA